MSKNVVHHLDQVPDPIFPFYIPILSSNDSSSKPPQSCNIVPSSILFVETIQKYLQPKALTVLFNPGSSQSFFHCRAIPIGATPLTLDKSYIANTTAGNLMIRNAVNLSTLTFPEFSKSLKFDHLQCNVFDQPDCAYDVIIGRDFLWNGADLDDMFVTQILEQKYEEVDIDSIVTQQMHLNEEQ